MEMDLLCQQNSCTSQQNVISPGCLWKVRGCSLMPLKKNFTYQLKHHEFLFLISLKRLYNAQKLNLSGLDM